MFLWGPFQDGIGDPDSKLEWIPKLQKPSNTSLSSYEKRLESADKDKPQKPRHSKLNAPEISYKQKVNHSALNSREEMDDLVLSYWSH